MLPLTQILALSLAVTGPLLGKKDLRGILSMPTLDESTLGRFYMFRLIAGGYLGLPTSWPFRLRCFWV